MERKSNKEEIVGAFIGLLFLIGVATYFFVNNHISNIRKEYDGYLTENHQTIANLMSDFNAMKSDIVEKTLSDKYILYFDCSQVKDDVLKDSCNLSNKSIKYYADNPSELN